MRLLFLASYFPRPSKPQIGTWALEQAKALSRQADVQVVCCTPYIPGILGILPKARPWIQVPRTHQWDNVSVEYFKTLYYPVTPFKKNAHSHPQIQMNIAWKSVRRRLLNTVERFKPDAIYAHHTAVNGYFAQRIYTTHKIPYIITDHDFAEIADCETLPRRREFFNRIIDTAKWNICVAKRMEADLNRIFPQGNTVTVHNGINLHSPEIFSTPRTPELQGKKVIFTAGMFVPRKGFPLLIEAFAKIAPRHPAALLRIAGGGPQLPEIQAAIAQHQLTDRVQLLGLLPQKQVFQEMAWSDLFALVSWDEPFATVFIEAMGAGKPIITASDGGINDVVVDRIHGRVVPPKNAAATAEALDQLLSDDAARLAMSRHARELVHNELNWDANSKRILALFKTPSQLAESADSPQTLFSAV